MTVTGHAGHGYEALEGILATLVGGVVAVTAPTSVARIPSSAS